MCYIKIGEQLEAVYSLRLWQSSIRAKLFVKAESFTENKMWQIKHFSPDEN